MNNNNNVNRNIVYSRVPGADIQNETTTTTSFSTYRTGALHLSGDNTTTTIRIDGEPPLLLQQQQQLGDRITSIDMEPNGNELHGINSGSNSATPSHSASMQRNFITFFNEARSQLGRQTSHPGTSFDQDRTISDQLGHSNDDLSLDVGASQDVYGHSLRHSNTEASFPTAGNSAQLGIRSWRMNLNNVLSFSSAPSTEALRSLISHSGGFRYTALPSNDSSAASANAGAGDNIHLLLNHNHQQPAAVAVVSDGIGLSSRISRSSSLRESSGASNSGTSGHSHQAIHNSNVTTSVSLPVISHDGGNGALGSNRSNDDSAPRQPNASGVHNHFSRNPVPPSPPTQADIDEENNVISDIFVKVLSHFMRYLPFVCILFVKFIHDHMLGILDLLTLHCCVYQINKSLREQIAKFSQKSYGILLRDFTMVAFVVSYRFLLASTMPDPFGLLIPPPAETVTIEVPKAVAVVPANEERSSASEVLSSYLSHLTAKPQPHQSPTQETTPGNMVTVTKALSLGVLLYYVAVNDLILKLLTILLKIPITMMPATVIRHKQRARMYVLVEYLSQFYRACVPVHSWLLFLFESYSGLEVISGILFSSFYIGAKGFEFFERCKSLRKAILNFVRNMDYERKPTKDELDAAGPLCPICHDTYKAPVVLECGHIFCDDCVSTWFKREQTCPMCRAKVSEDPAWQDGSTTFFYQLC